MLLAFRLANYRSIRDEQHLSFVATGFNERTAVQMPVEPRGTVGVLPVVGIYGKNASGKSNVLRGLHQMVAMVWSTGLNGELDGESLRGGSHPVPFLFDQGLRSGPTAFEIELLLEAVRYVYGFTFTDTEIRSEWLHAYPHGRRQVWFERDGPREKDFRFPGEHLKGPKAALVELVRPGTLLLGLVSSVARHPQLDPVARWFRRGLLTMHREIGRKTPLRIEERNLARFLTGRHGQRARQLIAHADLGVCDAEVEERETAERSELTVRLRHSSADGLVTLPLRDESEGTVSWLSALRRILPALDRGSVLLFDELTANLHPQLAAEVIRMFQDPNVNDRGAQLVFTSHDVVMLGTQFGAPLLDRDQIWFTEKGEDGATELYPLTPIFAKRSLSDLRGSCGRARGAAEVGCVAW